MKKCLDSKPVKNLIESIFEHTSGAVYVWFQALMWIQDNPDLLSNQLVFLEK